MSRNKNTEEQILTVNYSGKAHRFYKRCPWEQWWDEFCTSTMSNGGLRYPTAWAFAKTKATRIQEARWIQAATGPKPVLSKGRQKPIIPWLGDWQKRRNRGFWIGTEKAESLARVLKERATALGAARAVAGVSVEWLRRAEGLANQVDDYFGGQMFRSELSLKENSQRASAYLRVLKELFQISSQAAEDFLRCHGIHQDDVTILAQMQAVSLTAAQGPDAGKQVPQLPEGITVDDVLLAKMLRVKARRYRMELPCLQPEPELEGPGDDEFVESFNTSQFSNMASLLKECIPNEFRVHCYRSRLETYCRVTPLQDLILVKKEMVEFRRLMLIRPPSVLTRILTEKFGRPAPPKADDWTEFANHFWTVAADEHGVEWWKKGDAPQKRSALKAG